VPPRLDPEFHLEVLEIAEMGEDHGLTIPSQHVIPVRLDVYLGALAGKGRDRPAAPHKAGHYVMHNDLAFLRRTPAKCSGADQWRAGDQAD
jgi:hypothetical protein